MPGTRPGMTTGKPAMPRKLREPLRQKLGDRPCYGLSKCGPLIDRARANQATDPFATFSEWASEADEKA
jgi:antitoxin PrlF